MGEHSNIYENPPIFQNEYNNLEDKNEKKDEKEPNRLIDRVYFEKEKYKSPKKGMRFINKMKEN